MRDIIFDMLKYNRANDADEFMIEALLYRLFSSMMKGAAAGIPGTVKGNEYVRKAIEFIQNNYARPIHVKDVADYVNINRGYLYSLFKSETNMSPQEYLSNLRLTRAAEQLNTTNYSIEVIATSNGYGDPVVFTKAFKKMHGISPSKYRQSTVERSRKSLEE
jgi:AraC family transcriptional regulator of arabinose operon